MLIRSKLLMAFGVVLALAVAVAAKGIEAISDAEGLVVRLYDKPFMAVSYARAVQVRFSDARRTLERGELTGNGTSESRASALSKAIKDVKEDLSIVMERLTDRGGADRVKHTQELVQDWSTKAQQLSDT